MASDFYLASFSLFFSISSFFSAHLNPFSLHSLWFWQLSSPSHASTVRQGFMECGGSGVAGAGWVRYLIAWTSWLRIYADEDSSCPSANLLPLLSLEHTVLPPLHDYDLATVNSLLLSLSLSLLRGLWGHNYLMKVLCNHCWLIHFQVYSR